MIARLERSCAADHHAGRDLPGPAQRRPAL